MQKKHHTLSLAVIVKNEEVHLPTLMETARIYADEIIIVDTGSTDRTKEIARQYTDKIFDFVWVDDFSKARNFGLEKCTSDFIIWLDADDLIAKDTAQMLCDMKAKPIEWDVLYLPYVYARNAEGQITLSQVRERIFRNNKGLKFEFPIHECLKYVGELKFEHRNDIKVIHNKIVANEPSVTRNLRILSKAVETEEYRDNVRIWSYLAQESDAHKGVAYYEYIFREMCKEPVDKAWYSQTMVHYMRKLIALKKYDKALEAGGKAIAYYPLWREPFFYTAHVYFYTARYKEALKMMLIANDIPLPSDDAHIIYDKSIYEGDWFYEWLFFVYHYLWDRDKAVAVLEDVLKRNPNSQTFLRLKQEKMDWLYPKDAKHGKK